MSRTPKTPKSLQEAGKPVTVTTTYKLTFDSETNTYTGTNVDVATDLADFTGVAEAKLKYAFEHGGYIRAKELEGVTTWRACIDPFKKNAKTAATDAA